MKKITIISLLCILFLGFLLRRHNYLTWPREGSTFDEYAWTWLGMNILQKGKPVSWSPHPQYKLRTHYVSEKGTPYWLVEPYLEHPPLFGLIVGSYALFSGAKDMRTVDISHIRGLALILGISSILMVFLLAREMYGDEIGLVSSFLYAIIPTVVVGSRIVQNENFFIPGFLLVLYAMVKYIKVKRTRYFYGSAIVAGLLTLAKVPWWSAAIGGSFLLFYHRMYARVIQYICLVAGIFSLYFLWGYLWDWEVFINLWRFQLHRYDITFDGVFSLFTNPMLVDRSFLDGWLYAGWFAFFILLSNTKRHAVIIFGLLSYFAIYIFGIPNEPGHGWYRYPFYPFLAIALAVVFIDALKYRSLFLFFSSTVIGLSLFQNTWEPFFGFSYGAYRLFLILCGLTGISYFFHHKAFRKIELASIIFVFLLIFILNIWTILGYNEQ